MPLTGQQLETYFRNQGVGNTEVKPKYGEAIFAGTDYPMQWAGFIGQKKAKEQLLVQAASARARGARIEHTMLASGIHGVGKTTLATLVAYTAGVGFLQTTGPLTAAEARELMLTMQDHDILFIDEAHLLVQGGKTKADWLLPFMTEGVLYGKNGPEKMPDIAIVAATTDLGKLPETLISRFMCAPELVAYSAEEGADIAANLATRMGVEIDSTSASAIARAGDYNPRAMRRILTQVRDLGFAYPESHPNLVKSFDFAGVSPDGLTTVSRDMLLVLLNAKECTASIEAIGASLGEPGPLKHHEKQLLQHGLVEVTSRGRTLTEAGAERARAEIESRLRR